MFRCADGAVQLAVGSPQLWTRLCGAFGLDASDARFVTHDDRVRHRDELVELIEGAFASLSGAELLEQLATAGVPAGRVRALDEVYGWEQVESQRLRIMVDHPRLGPVALPGPPLRLFDAAGQGTTKTDHQAPPVLDADGKVVGDWVQAGVST